MSIKARLAAAGVVGAIALAGPVAYKWEGEVPKVYVDPVGILTACVGHTSPSLRAGQHFSKQECTELFVKDLRIAQAAVKRCIKYPLPVHTEAALISFTFNVGGSALCTSTLAKLANAGDLVGACKQLPRWVFGGGKVLPGLVNRRKDELNLCLWGVHAN
jgi:lysozyme